MNAPGKQAPADDSESEIVRLNRHLAGRYRVAPEQIVVGNGSSEILFALARACDYDRAVVPAPAYIDYAEAARICAEASTWPSLNSTL